VIAVLLTAAAAMGQDTHHAPMAEECKTDADLWAHEYIYNPTALRKLTVTELTQRKNEMWKCRVVLQAYPAYEQRAHDTATDYAMLLEVQMENFLKRHNLLQEFIEEDASRARSIQTISHGHKEAQGLR
jgi:hypothetical protein